MRRQRRGLALLASASTPPSRGPAQAQQGTHTQNTGTHTHTHTHTHHTNAHTHGTNLRNGLQQTTGLTKRQGKTAGQSVRVFCFQRLGPSAGGPTEVPIYYKGVLRLGSSSAFAPPLLGSARARARARATEAKAGVLGYRTCQSSGAWLDIRAHTGRKKRAHATR